MISLNPTEPTLVGEGGFGCVVAPALACSKKGKYLKIAPTIESARYVSKVMDNLDSSYTENKLAQLIASWKAPKGKKISDYFVVPTILCDVDLQNSATRNSLSKCSIFSEILRSSRKSMRPTYPQIIMPHSGTDMHDIFKMFRKKNQKVPLTLWINMLQNLLSAVKIMNSNGYAHFDIKLENVIYDGDKLRLFDFSLTEELLKTYKSYVSTGRSYQPYPLEFLIVHYYAHFNYKTKDYVLDKYNSSISGCMKNWVIYHPIENMRQEIDVLFRHINNKYADSYYDLVEYATKFASRVDTYSVGMMCINAHSELDFEAGIPKNMQEPVKTAYFDFVKKITHVDLRKRPTPTTALKLCNELIDLL